MRAGWALTAAIAIGVAAPAAAQSYDPALLAQNKAAADAFFAGIASPAGAADESIVYNLKDRAAQTWSRSDRATLAALVQGCSQMGVVPTIYAGESPKYGLLIGWTCESGRRLQTVVLVRDGVVYRVDIMPAGAE